MPDIVQWRNRLCASAQVGLVLSHLLGDQKCQFLIENAVLNNNSQFITGDKNFSVGDIQGIAGVG